MYYEVIVERKGKGMSGKERDGIRRGEERVEMDGKSDGFRRKGKEWDGWKWFRRKGMGWVGREGIVPTEVLE